MVIKYFVFWESSVPPVVYKLKCSKYIILELCSFADRFPVQISKHYKKETITK